jgi:hypothetical protein
VACLTKKQKNQVIANAETVEYLLYQMGMNIECRYRELTEEDHLEEVTSVEAMLHECEDWLKELIEKERNS